MITRNISNNLNTLISNANHYKNIEHSFCYLAIILNILVINSANDNTLTHSIYRTSTNRYIINSRKYIVK